MLLQVGILFTLFASSCSAKKVDYGYVPLGHNPTLYDAATEPIIQLDDVTFADTIYGADTAFIVEYYADWCGHCRAFAPFWKQFATLVSDWRPIVKVAVINCADPFNDRTCNDNNIHSYPTVKYFPRRSSSARNGVPLEALHSGDGLREQLLVKVRDEYLANRYADWPNPDFLANVRTYGELWTGTPPHVDYLAVIFQREERGSVGVQMMLDLSKYRQRIAIRRSVYSHPLTRVLRINQFPAVVVFRRDEAIAIFNSRLNSGTVSKLEQIAMGPDFTTTTTTTTMATTTMPSWSCRRNPEKCKELYYVSETDMLKSVRYALYNEVTRGSHFIQGSNLTALANFVELLANHFPTRRSPQRKVRGTARSNLNLQHSIRARAVFIELRSYLKTRISQGRIPTSEWETQFKESEKRHFSPFPEEANWQHCRGSTPMLRGYTCGLWTSFHAMTVHAYMEQFKNSSFRGLRLLHSIQGWVQSFFGCENCKEHFMDMTKRLLPMEAKVKKAQDVIFYLWEAHNMVNRRLHGDTMTEDPEFPKYQFPAQFLCNNCTDKQHQFDKREVKNFLVNYYTSIKPHNSIAGRRISAGAA
uniref:Sulfhydryl oxidase n=1 Tax=Plectus sambesii TaxID=2011161 RepID=A0A914WG07_9BILA